MLIVMAGLPGTGKSTIARALAVELNALVLDKDSIRAALFPPDLIEYSREQDDFCVDVMLQVAKWHLKRDPQRAIILDGRTYTYAYQRQRIEDAAKAMPVRTQWILFTCSDEVAQQRLADDHANGSHPAQNRTPALYADVKAHYETFTLPHLRLDTGQAIDACVRECVAWLKGASHGTA